MPKVLISDKMSPLAQETFEKRGVEVDVITDLSPDNLLDKIGAYDGLAVRSSTTVTPDLLKAATNLKVVGRAGIGVDNIDIPAATQNGVVVMNTPFGNSITTAEHAISMMMALARQIPQANESTHAGKWEKKKFMGVEVYAKTLGIIGCGNIGSIVASRAMGLDMKVIAFDPFLTPERATEIGIEKVDFDTLLSRADFITIHVPKNEKTINLLNKDAFAKIKKGVRIINCARGGIINEADLKEALDDGTVAGAALDVFNEEPAKENILFGHPNVICTPHLGASTSEAQINVALQVAEQISDFLLDGGVTNALNMPSISAEEAPKLKPYLALISQLGSFAGQITDHAIKEVEIIYQGNVSKLNTKPLTAMCLAEFLKPVFSDINMVNATLMATKRGIDVVETKREKSGDQLETICVGVTTEKRSRDITGTLFGGQPRILNVEGIPIETAVSPYMLYVRNEDKPGLIGSLGTLLGEAKCNIANFNLGRKEGSDTAVAIISIDNLLEGDVLEKLKNLPNIIQVKQLKFEGV